MSHTPASAKPDERPTAPAKRDAAPLSSEAPGTATGNREGGGADRAALAAGEPEGTASVEGQSAVDGTVTAEDAPA